MSIYLCYDDQCDDKLSMLAGQVPLPEDFECSTLHGMLVVLQGSQAVLGKKDPLKPPQEFIIQGHVRVLYSCRPYQM